MHLTVNPSSCGSSLWCESHGPTVADVTPNCASALADALYGYGIRNAYGIHGANSEDLFAALLRAPRDRRVRLTIAKHEFGAGAMADGATRITGRPSCLIATSGGAAMNCVPALAEAYQSRVPVLALIGCPPTGSEGHGAFQDMCNAPRSVDAPALFRAVTGYSARVGAPSDLGPALAGAFDALDSGLPAALLLPKDVQVADAQEMTAERHYASPPTIAPSAEVIDALRAARRPLILLGGAASRARVGRAVGDLARATGAVIAVGPNGRDLALGDGHTVGVSGVMGHPSVVRAAGEADLILALGTDLDVMDRGGLEPALRATFTVHADAQPPLFEVSVHEPAPDVPGYIRGLVTGLGPGPDRPPWTTAGPEPIVVPRPESGRITCADAVDTLAETIPPDALVFADAGNAGAAAVHRLPLGTGSRFVVALGMGGMGFGIAAGVGAAIATGRRTVILAGDGAFYMHGMEIHTAIEANAPVLLVVFNNDAHGMCVAREERFFSDLPSLNLFRHTRIGDGLAAMFPTMRVRTAGTVDEIRTAALDLAETRGGPECLVIDTDPLEIPPFAAILPATAKEPR
ncbi:thiamine pyrophosphate-binding protein [Tsukamurella strandjordii]|uniref:acetolactate synthase n=1 Tax=Tsukamurella strandjordii TaxID=147577 RepID=A0AA90SKM9_9ACTN|nr:thiamine pyrophosphate-binding protein [Tsukamurella strandjordii]MDP0397418.1 thiamine pyrophosphate-binding protein [Tsukamurella strandjordii]